MKFGCATEKSKFLRTFNESYFSLFPFDFRLYYFWFLINVFVPRIFLRVEFPNLDSVARRIERALDVRL